MMTAKSKQAIVVIGSGNVSTQLALAMYDKGLTISQVFSRQLSHAQKLSSRIKAEATDDYAKIITDAPLYIIAVADNAIEEVAVRFSHVAGLVVHTSGSVDINVLEGCQRYGVLYPLQTFSKNRPTDFSTVPFLIEAAGKEDEVFLAEVASILSSNVHSVNSKDRSYMHLAAVFACNFSNYMYAAAEKVLKSKGLKFEMLHPLIKETAQKASEMAPSAAQTGPALRKDYKVINKHLEMLKDDEELRALYQQISHNIPKE